MLLQLDNFSPILSEKNMVEQPDDSLNFEKGALGRIHRRKTSAPKKKAEYTKEMISRLGQAIHGLRVKCEARGLVDCFDQLMLHSEKIRRLEIRVKVRSNHMRKKALIRMLKDFILITYKERKNHSKAK